jgi:hypothetical protein
MGTEFLIALPTLWVGSNFAFGAWLAFHFR